MRKACNPRQHRKDPQATRLGGNMGYILLILPAIAACITPIYNQVDPKLAGFPLFFWFHLALVPVTALCIFVAYRQGAK